MTIYLSSMLLEIVEIPRLRYRTMMRKLLRLRCDECGKNFERGWQREVSEQSTHCCCRKCSYLLRSKSRQWHERISASTKKRMSDPDVRQHFEDGIKRRDENVNWRQNISIATKHSYACNPNRAIAHSNRVKQKFSDPLFREAHRLRCTQRINPWWHPWMELIREDIHWANRIYALYRFRCAICEATENLCAHHIAPKSRHAKLRYDINNGVTLCRYCHVAKNNPQNVHKLLRSDIICYEQLMKELLAKRSLTSQEDIASKEDS